MFITKQDFEDYESEIDTLKEKICVLEASEKFSKKITKKQKETMSAMQNELKVFYLKAIGDCETVKQVEAIKKQYYDSKLYQMQQIPISFSNYTVCIYGGGDKSQMKTDIQLAISTKIKRINRKNIVKTCKFLDNETCNATYAHVMMSEIKEMAGIEVDGKKILDFKASGLDAMSVFKSMLSAYNIKQDDVFAE